MTVRAFVVATTCKTVGEFIERYHTRCDDSSIFISILDERLIGVECAFAILLADRQPVFAGICQVSAVNDDANHPYAQRGMRLEIRKLGVTSEEIFAQMAALRYVCRHRFARGSIAPPEDALLTEHHSDGDVSFPDIEIEAAGVDLAADDAATSRR